MGACRVEVGSLRTRIRVSGHGGFGRVLEGTSLNLLSSDALLGDSQLLHQVYLVVDVNKVF